jgi:tRNA A-37 threonylcarbamoyl transferase component Bud32
VHDGRAGFWCELIQGQTLETLLRVERGLFGASEVVAIGTELCGTLFALHSAGILHGNVKGSNVMREQGGRIVLMDLGA